MAKINHKYILIGLGTFWTVVTAWMFYNMQAKDVDSSVLKSNHTVRVHQDSNTYVFSPVADTMQSALIFYSGALVDPEAYAPMARNIAESGYTTIIIQLPYRLAFFEYQQENLFKQTLNIISADSLNRNWVVGGHSRGGKLATLFAMDYQAALDGLLLVGTSHPREIDLSHLNIDITKIYGTNDGLASVEEIHQFSRNLPAKTHYVRVEGGNHRQFGYYGYQLGDSTADISRKKQHEITVGAILEQLQRL